MAGECAAAWRAARAEAGVVPNAAWAALGSQRLLASSSRPPCVRCLPRALWLHVPKCGTSFYSTLLRYTCPGMPDDLFVGSRRSEEGCPIRGGSIPCATRQVGVSEQCWQKPIANRVHRIMGDDAAVEDFVGMFRDPARRLVSGHDHRSHNLYSMNKRNMTMEEMAAKEHERPPHFWGANGKRCGALRETLVERWASQRGYAGGDGEGEGLGAAWDEVAEGKRLSSEIGVLHYALCAGIRSCQTRLVLGAYVHDPQAGEARPQYPNPNKTLSRHYFYGNPCGSQRDLALRCEHLQRALERVGRMAFVGVTDRWNPSVCLFHATFGGEPHPTLLRKFRHVSHDDKDNDAKRALEERLRDADGWDTALFVHVETLFNARLAMYGVPEEAAPGEQYIDTCRRALRELQGRRMQAGCPAPPSQGAAGVDADALAGPEAAQSACERPLSVVEARAFDGFGGGV